MDFYRLHNIAVLQHDNMGFISADHQCQNETEGNQALMRSNPSLVRGDLVGGALRNRGYWPSLPWSIAHLRSKTLSTLSYSRGHPGREVDISGPSPEGTG